MVQNVNYPGQDVYEVAFQTAMEGGSDMDTAKKMAGRKMHEAGFYQTKDGWTRLGPDLRGKINVREAEAQDDGTYVIRDVDVFYPNAVKGGEDVTTWTPERVGRAIENTNRAIEAGGQATAVTRGHVYPEQKALGISIPSLGKAINWRMSPRGEGWARCDLVNVDPEVVNDWKARKITGLSAGFVQDAGLNERFGHIALLGGESQALSELPTTEVFSANGLAQLCYSAEVTEVAQMDFAAKHAEDDLPGPKTTVEMPEPNQEIVMDPAKASSLKSAYSGLSTAYAGLEAGEPGAEEKVAEAHQALDSAVQACGGAAPAQAPATPAPAAPAPSAHAAGYEGDEKPVDTENGAGYAGQAPQETSYLPEKPEGNLHDITATQTDVTPQPGKNFAAQPAGARAQVYSAAQVDQRFSALASENRELKIAVAALTGRQMRNDFAAEVSKLTSDGHQIDMEASLKMFDACDGDKNRVGALLGLLKTAPKSALTTPGATFGASEGGSPAGAAQQGQTFAAGGQPTGAQLNAAAQATDDEVMQILQKHGGGVNYTAEDLRIGSIATGYNAAAPMAAH